MNNNENWVFCYWDDPVEIKNLKTNKDENNRNSTSREESVNQTIGSIENDSGN